MSTEMKLKNFHWQKTKESFKKSIHSFRTLFAFSIQGYFMLMQPPPVAVLKTSRREVLVFIPGRNCRPSHSEFSMVFSETRINAD